MSAMINPVDPSTPINPVNPVNPQRRTLLRVASAAVLLTAGAGSLAVAAPATDPWARGRRRA